MQVTTQRQAVRSIDAQLPSESAQRSRLPSRRGPRNRNASPIRNGKAERLAQQLGWFSIGLGLAELLAPRAIARICGVNGERTGLIQFYGMREIAAGLLIFSQGRRPVGGMWVRVAGDVVDVATLAAAARAPDANKAGVAFAMANVLAVTALDVKCARELGQENGGGTGRVQTVKSIVINRPPEELYHFWKNLENLPRFMYHVQSVRMVSQGVSHWVVNAPIGGTVEWDSEVTEDVANERISWQAHANAEVPNRGTVWFEPRTNGPGTIVTVQMEYSVPGGVVASKVAKLFNESPEQQLYDDLRRLKQVMETGEVLRSDANPHGTGEVKPRPARPLETVPPL